MPPAFPSQQQQQQPRKGEIPKIGPSLYNAQNLKEAWRRDWGMRTEQLSQ